jgi:hypothetical protein
LNTSLFQFVNQFGALNKIELNKYKLSPAYIYIQTAFAMSYLNMLPVAISVLSPVIIPMLCKTTSEVESYDKCYVNMKAYERKHYFRESLDCNKSKIQMQQATGIHDLVCDSILVNGGWWN